MKILYCLPDFPYPPAGGGPLRIMGLVMGAVHAGHEVHILSFGDAPADTPLHRGCASVETISAPTRSKLDRLRTLLLTGKADMQTRRWSDAFLIALLRKLHQEKFDIVQFQSLEMTPYLLAVREQFPDLKLIYDAYNAEADLQKMAYQTDLKKPTRLPFALYSRMQWKRIARLEATLGRQASAILAVSEIDQQVLQQTAACPVHLVANGIHVKEYLTPPADTLDLKPNALVFTGIMDYRPNVDAAVWFADEVLPHIPNAHFYVVGNRPDERVQALSTRENITITGFVQEIVPYLHAGAVFVVPMRVGSGTRFKLLQAMAAGSAIVSTTVGAAGLNITSGQQMRIADNAMSFAAAVNDLLRDDLKRRELGASAQVYVQRRFDWSVIVPQLLAVYEDLAAVQQHGYQK
jgi:glycosyltransferase involved in cell wall biosynthesis